MKHVTSISKARPKEAFSLPSFSLAGIKAKFDFSMADTVFKTPTEKGKGTTT